MWCKGSVIEFIELITEVKNYLNELIEIKWKTSWIIKIKIEIKIEIEIKIKIKIRRSE